MTLLRSLGLAVVLLLVAQARADAPDRQLVTAEDYFFVPYPENMNATAGQISLGKTEDKPSEYDGCKRFFVERENRSYDAKTYFQTRLAQPAELFVGRWVVYPLSPLKTAADKKEMGWGYRRIVNLGDAPKGQVIVAGKSNPVVEASWLRVIVGGEPDPKITLTGKEDAHHFHPEHWVVLPATSAPDPTGVDTKLAIAIRAPAKRGDEGTFLVIDSGAIITTKNAWHSHVATRGELKAGTRVVFFGDGMDVPERDVAYRGTWWVGPLTEVTPSYIKIGHSSARAELMRIVE